MITRISKALAARREALAEGEKGFTLIELLVVVIIIGILAAIAIPVYIGVQNNAKDSATKSDIENAKTAVVAYYTANGSYPTGLGSLSAEGYPGPSVGDTLSYTAPAATSTTFCIAGASPTQNVFHATDSSGVTSGGC
ncbi:MAG TPA: prepilin-type N-terminal cleavage/methylation domain-containing protein [Pseudolysinimonas sp.]|nr:prepilin-type N-terminal cleavage/methylation domain-containing protein [Pseudolysinimonas sp.]